MKANAMTKYMILCSLAASMTIATVGVSPSHAADAKGEANKQLVQNFLRDVRQASMVDHDPKKVRQVVEQYMAENYIQHSAIFAPGREGYLQGMLKQFSNVPKEGAPMPPMPKMKDIYFLADGDLVTWVSEFTSAEPGPASASSAPKYDFNMMRIENGKLAEHWGTH
jgi:predicted SnoaL-like aldol condensation-catalyzing enzyme